MRWFSASTVLAECGEISTFGRSHKGLSSGSGSTVCHVERGAAETALAQRLHQGRLVDHGAARDVDQQRALGHGGKLGRADQPPGLGRQRTGQDQGIDLAEHGREIGHRQQAAHTFRRRPGRATSTPDLQALCREALGDGPADGAEANHQCAPAGQLPVGVALPLARTLHALQPRHVAIEVEQRKEHELAERRAVHTGGGGEQQVAVDQAGAPQPLADAGAGALHPAQPGRVLEQPLGREPVEVEQDVGLAQMRQPAFALFRAQDSRPAVVVGDVARYRQKLRLKDHLDPAGCCGGDPLHLLGLERRGDQDLEGTILLHASDP